MSTLGTLFSGERIKWRRSWVTVAAILCPACQVGFLAVIFWFSDVQVSRIGPGFSIWYQLNHAAWNIIFMPITVALVALLSWDQEEEASAWKHLLVQPVPKRAHYLVKLLSHGTLLAMAQLVFTAALLGCGFLFKKTLHTVNMGPSSLDLAARLALFSFLGALPLLAFHTWLSARFGGVGLALGLTLAGSLSTVLLAGIFPPLFWLPWGLANQGVRLGATGMAGSVGFFIISMLVAAGLMALGTADFSRREEPR